jgi:hypothetical protein
LACVSQSDWVSLRQQHKEDQLEMLMLHKMSSGSNQIYIESFNNKLQEFLVDLSETFPELKDIRMLKSSFVMVKNINPRLPQKVFNEHIAREFDQKIRNRDENFFLEYNYEDIVENVSKIGGVQGNAVQALDFVGQLKRVWRDLTEENKDVVWKYMTVLLVLNEKCS